MEEGSRFKKWVMLYLWRVQQSQAIISIGFWALTITGIFYPWVEKKFMNFGLPQSSVLGGMLIMFLIVIAVIVGFGILYDKLKFWKESTVVIQERNPYSSYKLLPIHLFWMDLWIETARCMPNKSPELEERIKFMEAWSKRCEETDPWTAEMRASVRDWALGGDMKAVKALSEDLEE